jgi:predicted dehydrogenase
MSNRREFLKHATAGAALAAPYLWSGQPLLAQQLPSSNSGLRIAAIGVGGSRSMWGQGGNIARQAANFGELVAVCDVDDIHTAEFNRGFDNKLAMYRDYRELLTKEKPDVVTIGTPDHWHIPIAIAALRSGCHVYCEKPLTLTIDEGIAIRQAVQETGKVFQVGTQQRTEHDQRFVKAASLVRSGRLGKKVNAFVAIGSSEVGGPYPTAPVPSDVDWNLWLGPAQQAEYSPERRKHFRWYYDYSGGQITDWGAHHIDISQWALGHENSGPVKVGGTAKYTDVVPENFDWYAYLNGESPLPNGFHTAVNFNLQLDYADGTFISLNDFYKRDDGTNFGNGILLEGELGRIFVNREKLSGKPIEDLTESDKRELDEWIVKLYKGKEPRRGHVANFFECIAGGGEPVSDVDTHHRTMTAAHLSNISLMLRREVNWDPAAEKFVDDPEAEKFRSRKRREGFDMA